MKALFGCPYFQLAPLKVNGKVKEMSHSEHKCHSAQEKREKGASQRGASAGARLLWFAGLAGSYERKSWLGSAGVFEHLKSPVRGWSCSGIWLENPGDALEELGSVLVAWKTQGWSGEGW